MERHDYDAVVVGSGPNGLAAAITLQQQGLSVLVLESKDTIGGGTRTQQLTLPGFHHDVCSAILPMAAASPFFSTLPLQQYGLEYIDPPVAAAHPFDDGSAAILKRSIEETARLLGNDEQAWLDLVGPVVRDWPSIAPDLLGPLRFPRHPGRLAAFGLRALPSAATMARRFSTQKAKGLWAGLAAHAIQPLTNLTTSAVGLVLAATGHCYGWPVPKGGAISVTNALAAYFRSLGGTIQTGFQVTSLQQLPSSQAVLFDITPKQLLAIAGDRFSALYKRQLGRFRYGMGVFKVDWALDGPVPFTAPECREAGTVHLGSTFREIAAAEQMAAGGGHPQRPYVLLAQQSLFDDTRAPAGQHTAWAYCHVPNGSLVDMTNIIEEQVERYAPGFRKRILARHTFNTQQLQQYNANYIGGDINGGILDIGQLYTRPAFRLSPYKTTARGLYICSSSTPPGGGVHGMCGHHAARKALRDIFRIR